MRRISVIGSASGVGKTTFGRRLAERLDIPFIELDQVHWGPRWTALSAEEFRARVLELLPPDGWVVDGNYGKLGGVVWQRADTIVWLDLPLQIALWRTLRRTLRRIRAREELWAGNRETLRNAFFARDSLLVYAVRTYRRRRRGWEARLRSGDWSHATVRRFRSNADADRWLASL